MSAQDGAAISRHGDIIIVRRRHEEEEAHHGGVWKIAFADFMTALMAFFLVMWLVNASDESTRRQVAQYFNPIKLNASTPPTPGLDTGETTPASQEPLPLSGETEAPGASDGKPVGGTETGGEDQAIFRDPYAVLAEIVAEGGGPGTQTGRNEPVPDGTGLPGLNGGDAYRDPFDPTSWQLQPNAEGRAEAEREAQSQFATLVVEPTPAVATAAEAEAPEAVVEEPAEAPAPAGSEADRLEQQLRMTTTPGTAAGVEVSEGEGGITISLADSLTSGMFEIGSARPNAATISLMEEIARVLSEREGTVIIRGHTDARPYRGEEFDNWRLSTARAHMAYYMLLRGGLDEARVSAIEGFADRRLKNPAEPDAAENRRIEILLQEPAA
ncbi:flagellar motor protein MotB [Aureimonas populi]|uniref:Flagellar motor protein MotB n=1 Tax=Aureimonas populi TaxID=1701758 RepID=A0ABW5CHD6_9HYPH|nr:flagellar motor protein MotB [Aureimonas populi]